jgi:hypothetical protein
MSGKIGQEWIIKWRERPGNIDLSKMMHFLSFRFS